jgi:hypothetical protein
MNHRSVRGRRRLRSTPEERGAWVQRYWRSGLSQVQFAAQHQLGLSSLRKWIAQSPVTVASTSNGSSGWHEVQLTTAGGPRRWAAEVVRPDGWTLRVAPEASPAWVGELLRASSC